MCELGRKNSRTLGFFPAGAFRDHADRRNILVHLDGQGNVDGYVAFRLTGMPRQVRIAHLCVREECRGRGIARQLLDELVRQTGEALGIGLYCRPEYEANSIWPHLDFKPRGRKAGRGTDQAELVFWWRDNGHQTLFSQAVDVEYLETSAVKAVLDANILFDLDHPERAFHEESRSLLADWLAPLVEFSVGPELHLEIHRQQDGAVQTLSRKRAATFETVPVNTDRLRQLADRLRQAVGWGSDDNSVSDAKHIAYASLGGYRYFLTRDQTVLNAAQEIEDLCGVIALRPSDFIMRVHELQREDQYRPVHLGDTKIRARRLREADSQLLYDRFRNHASGELKKDFQQRITSRLAQPNRHENSLYETQGGRALILTSTGATADLLQLEFFRTAQDPLVPLLARYALNRVVLDASSRQKPAVLCTDPDLSDQAASALGALGFHRTGGPGHLKLTPRLLGSPAEVARGLRELPVTARELREEAERMALSVEVAAERPLDLLPQVGRVLWPTRILHEQLGNFIIPIRPVWARKLFDEGVPGLFSDQEHERLLLNWENVYYSLARRQALLRPGSHILWYVSREAGYSVSALRACSTVEEVRVGTARELYQAFRRLGVYRLRDLTAMTGGTERPLLAIRFSRTELFSNSVGFEQIQACRVALGGRRNNLQGPVRISDEEFRTLYRQGTGTA